MANANPFHNVPNKLKLIIFDLDGTLVDSSKPMGEAFNHTLDQLNISEYSKRETDALIGIPLSKIFMKILNRPTRDTQIEKCIRIYREKYLELCCKDSFLYDGVAETLPKLAKKYSISLATTKKTDVAKLTLEHFQLIEHFKLILGFDSVSEPKPSPEIIEKTLMELNFDREETMMVGDSIYDLNAGSAASVITCVVTYGFEKEEILRANNPDIIIDNFNQLSYLL